MFPRIVRQQPRRIVEALGFTGRRTGIPARPSPFRPVLEALDARTLPSVNPIIGDVFYIEMENHNLTQPGTVPSPAQLLNNPAAPYLNSLMTPGNPNAAQTSYASNYYNVLFNNPSVSIHPSEPNYVWQEAGLAGPLNDADPFPSNIVNAPNLSALLQGAGISWKSYQEDIDLVPNSGSVNQPGASSLTSAVAPQDQWTVPLKSFSGTSPDYTNPYYGAHQYNFAAKHDGSLFFTATNGGNDFSPSNPEAKYYAPLQQLQTDLNNNTVARYSLITPNQFNDMHSSLNTDFVYNGTTWTHNTDQQAIAIGDHFLSQIVPTIMASQAYKNNGVIVIWFDETENGNTTSFTIPEIIISPLAKGNAFNSTLTYTHSSDLKTMQELFGVSAPGGGFLGDANTPGTNDLSDMFVPGVFAPSSVGGRVVKNSGRDDQPSGGITIVLTGINNANEAVTLTTTTAADGSYSFSGLLPGTYSVTVQGVKKDVGIGSITLGVGETPDHEDFSLLGPDSQQ
ncbi:MAG: carboxypeptidase regulatory-like domain-containing protein [Zavarzinella sp.]|nr:carboxypeptidase regulatory-like domain-containing protein [Zavarzinella sp.]